MILYLLLAVDPKKLQEFIQLLEESVKNLEKQGQLSNDQIKGLFKTFLDIQIENTKFVSELAMALEKQNEQIKKLSSKNTS